MSEVLSKHSAPLQRGYIERVIGTIQRECLDRVIVVNERSLRRHLHAFVASYHQSRTYLGFQTMRPCRGRCRDQKAPVVTFAERYEYSWC